MGKLSYSQGIKLQETIRVNVKNGNQSGVLITLQHNPVYTVGIRNATYSEEYASNLKKLGADFVRTNRGGLITFHGPGQLVAYPIINLKHFYPSVRWYVHQLENVIVKLCSHYGLNANTSPLTGVWVNDEKVCAMGVHVSSTITTHGLALNCNTDLSWFSHIVPCGIQDKGVTSLSKLLNRDVPVDRVLPVFCDSFESIFECQLQPCDYLQYQKEFAQIVTN